MLTGSAETSHCLQSITFHSLSSPVCLHIPRLSHTHSCRSAQVQVLFLHVASPLIFQRANTDYGWDWWKAYFWLALESLSSGFNSGKLPSDPNPLKLQWFHSHQLHDVTCWCSSSLYSWSQHQYRAMDYQHLSGSGASVSSSMNKCTSQLSCTSVEAPLGAASLRVGNVQTQISISLQIWKRGHYLNSIWATVIEVNHILPKIIQELNLEIEDAAVEKGWFCSIIMSQQTASRFLHHLDCADVFQWCYRCQGKIWLDWRRLFFLGANKQPRQSQWLWLSG